MRSKHKNKNEEGQFIGVQPQRGVMVGRSSSSSSFTYDVYLSCGASESDTRTLGFSRNLYKALFDKGILTFINDGLPRPDDIMSSLNSKAIESSRIAIVVISENYAFSSFFLAELVYILDRRAKKGLLVWPVFYQVGPSDVRQLKGGFHKAFASHEERFDKYSVLKWKSALIDVAHLKAFHLFKHGSGYERDFIKNVVEEVSKMINQVPSQVAQKKVPSQVAPRKVPSQDMLGASRRAEMVWRLVGLASSVVGMLCHALSPSFTSLIRGWNYLKLFLYCVFFLVVCASILFGKQFPLLRQQSIFRSYVIFAVLIIISVYSFLYDKAINGKPEIKSLVANAAFTLMSLSLSKLIKSGYEIGMFAYFLGCFTIQLVTINWALILVAIVFGCPLFVMHSSSDSPLDAGNEGQLFHSSLDSQPHVGSAGQHVVDIPNEESKLVSFDSGYDSDYDYYGSADRTQIGF